MDLRDGARVRDPVLRGDRAGQAAGGAPPGRPEGPLEQEVQRRGDPASRGVGVQVGVQDRGAVPPAGGRRPGGAEEEGVGGRGAAEV